MNHLYIQLFGVGVLWVSLHCGGMCGPIMAGLSPMGCAMPAPGAVGWRRLAPRVRGVLAYQAGRGLVYGLMGAAVGAMGLVVEARLGALTRVSGLVASGVIIAVALMKLTGRGEGAAGFGASVGRRVGEGIRRVARLVPRAGAARMAAMGALLALMPCMLVAWVLSLAAASASPLHGAGLMWGLILMTTPVLLISACVGPLAGRWRHVGERLVPWGLLASGVWTGLVAVAANGWIRHIHLPFMVGGERYVIMLW
jgi:sulfite exporter TauE/SafE